MNDEISNFLSGGSRFVYESARQKRFDPHGWKWHGPYVILAVLDFETTDESQLRTFLQHLADEIHDWKSSTGGDRYTLSGLICVAPEQVHSTSHFSRRYTIRIWFEDVPLFHRAWTIRPFDRAHGLLWQMLLDSGVTFVTHPRPVNGIIRDLHLHDASGFVIRQPSGLEEERAYSGDMWFRLDGAILEQIASLATKLPVDERAA